MSIVRFDYKFDAVNIRMCEITGYSEPELLAKTFLDITYPDDIEQDKKLAGALFRNEIPHYVVEKRYIKKDDTLVWVQLTVSLIKDENGAPLYYLAMIEDIDVKKKAMLELEKMNYEKDKFFSIIAHDLKSPLSTLVGISEILAEDIDELSKGDTKQLAEVLQSSARMTLNLLEDLLDWSRYNSGKISFDPEKLSLNLLINEAAKLYRLNISQKKIRLIIESPEEISINGDRNMIYTSLRNLLSNAVKFTRIGGEIKIITKRISLPDDLTNTKMSGEHKEKSIVRLWVRDNGVGIKSEKLDSLFEFDSLKSTMGTDNELGTGLGLVLVKEFIGKNGGSVRVESQPDVGSTFIIDLPCN